MKNIFLIIISFFSFSLVLGMEEVPISVMQSYMKNADEALRKGDKEKALEFYGKILNFPFPPDDARREIRFDALGVIGHEIKNLKDQGKYEEALKIYKYAPQNFSVQIKQMEVFLRFKKDIEQAKQLIGQKKSEDALKILDNNELKRLDDIVELKVPFEKKIKTDLLQNYMQKVQRASSDKEKLEWYGRAANVYLPDYIDPYDPNPYAIDPYKDVRPFNQEAINKIVQIVVDLKNRGEYKEALKVYEYAPQTFSEYIVELQKILPFQEQIAQVKRFANENKFAEALGIITNQLKDIKNFPQIIKLKASIEAKKQEWERKQKPSEQKTWIFLRTIDRPGIEKSNWRIADSKLYLNAAAEDPISLNTFVDLIAIATTNKIPFILLGLRNNEGFYHFYGDSFLPELLKNWKNPETQEAPDAVEIFVAGDDGKLTFLNLIKKDDEMFKYVDAFKGLLQKSGEGHLLIAKFFKDKGTERFKQTVTNEDQIREAQIALQYARQWYDWAMNYFSPGSFKYRNAESERDAIPYKPEILPQEPMQPEVPEVLMQSIQNLTRGLRQVASKLV